MNKFDQEDSISNLFIEKVLGKNIKSYRPDNNDWPDRIIIYNDFKIALELTELLLPNDLVHTNRKILNSHERHLEFLITKSVIENFQSFGCQINVDIDLERLCLKTNNEVKKLSIVILSELLPFLGTIKNSSEIRKYNLFMEELKIKFKIYSRKNWSGVTCCVGYKGSRLENLNSDYIQSIIDKKDKMMVKNHNKGLYDQCWLLINEEEASMRDEIDFLFNYISFYNKVYLQRIEGSIIKLNIYSNP